MKRLILTILVLLTFGLCYAADTMPTTEPASAPATPKPATAPAPTTITAPTTASAPAADPAAMKILKDLESAGDRYATIQANLDYTFEDPNTGETEARTGTVSYQKGGEKEAARFRIHFDTLKQNDGPKIKDAVDYAFDGEYLSVAKHRVKQLMRYQVAAKGQKVEPLRLGKGPFPMPFGQKADDVLKYFTVTTAAPITTRPVKADDPKNADYLKLTARPEAGKEVSFQTLDMWIDRDTHLPAKLISVSRAKQKTTVIFGKIEPDAKLAADVFTIPKQPGWTEKIVPLEKEGPGREAMP